MFQSEEFAKAVHNQQILKVISGRSEQELFEAACKVLATYDKKDLAEILWAKFNTPNSTYEETHKDIEQLINGI